MATDVLLGRGVVLLTSALRCLCRRGHELHPALGAGTVVVGSTHQPKARVARRYDHGRIGVIGSLALSDFSVILFLSASVSTSDSLVGVEPKPPSVTYPDSRILLK